MRSRRSRRSLKVSHTQTSVPCGTLKNVHYNTALHLFNQFCTGLNSKCLKIIISHGQGFVHTWTVVFWRHLWRVLGRVGHFCFERHFAFFTFWRQQVRIVIRHTRFPRHVTPQSQLVWIRTLKTKKKQQKKTFTST